MLYLCGAFLIFKIMKKIIVSTLCLFFLCAALSAQSLAFLKDETRVGLKIDFSEAAINGYTEANILDFEEDWEKDQPVLFEKFQMKLNEYQRDRQFGHFPEANYTLIYKPLIINRKGDMKGYFVIEDKDGNEVANIKGISVEGGKFGTFLNLVGDGMKSSGKAVSKMINRNLK